MTLQQKKELYEQGNHICLLENKFGDTDWSIHEDPKWNPQWGYQLIHKKHRHILDAYLDGCEVYVCPQTAPEIITDFIEGYEEEWEYLAIPGSLKNCYCEATNVHYQILYSIAKNPGSLFDFNYAKSEEYYVIFPNGQNSEQYSKTYAVIEEDMNKVEWNESIQNWVYCPKETEDEANNYSYTGDNHSDNSRDVTMQENTINNFNDYGFTADFPGHLTGEMVEFYNQTYLLGYFLEGKMKHPRAQFWNKDTGRIWQGECNTMYNLTPIVPEYPLFKKNEAGDVLRIDSELSGTWMLLANSDFIGDPENLQEIPVLSSDYWTDIPYDSERGFYHGQPVWVHFADDASMIYFYNADKDLFHTAGGGCIHSSKVEPIALEALQHMPFVWEQYQAFIKEK